jgi:hypothetical protein
MCTLVHGCTIQNHGAEWDTAYDLHETVSRCQVRLQNLTQQNNNTRGILVTSALRHAHGPSILQIR